MRQSLGGLAPGAPLAAAVLELADQLLLLGVDRDRRLTRRDRRRHALVDVPELGVAIGVLRALQRLAVGLQAVAQRTQQRGDRRVVGFVSALAQLAGELSHALGGPQEDLHRVAAAVVGDERLQRLQQHGIGLRDRLAPAAAPPHATLLEPLARVDLAHPLADRVRRDPARARHRRDPAAPEHARLRGRPDPPAALTELRRQSPEPLPDQRLIDHAPEFYEPRTRSCTLFIYASLVKGLHATRKPGLRAPDCSPSSVSELPARAANYG